MSPEVIAAIIGGVATIAAAIIGREWGKRVAQKHSLLKFMDEQEKLLKRAMNAIEAENQQKIEAVATAIVDTAMTWRRIQENFGKLLNGRIDEVNGLLRERATRQLSQPLRALNESFPARRLAVETELKKSTI